MQLNRTLETFSQDAWEQTFGAFVKANRSHWRGAPYDAVINQLKAKGKFEFSVTGMGTWTSKFVLTVNDEGLDAQFVANSELSPTMQIHLQKMEQVFAHELTQAGLLRAAENPHPNP